MFEILDITLPETIAPGEAKKTAVDIRKVMYDIQLQRTPEWFERRRGVFTGSKISELMKSGVASKKYEWGHKQKIVEFSDVAIKYIYSKYKERKRGKVLKRDIGMNGDYGKAVEKIVKDTIYKEWDECGFEMFIPGIAGASPDGKKGNRGLEIKAAMEWETEYLRVCNALDYQHKDFWQLQSEMLALKADSILYVVAEPSETLTDVCITDVNEMIVERSVIHQECIVRRCLIGDEIIKRALDTGNFNESVSYVLTNTAFVECDVREYLY